MRPPPLTSRSQSMRSRNSNRALFCAADIFGSRCRDVTTDVHGFTSAGKSAGLPIIAFTSDVLPALTWPIIVIAGSNSPSRACSLRVRSIVARSPTLIKSSRILDKACCRTASGSSADRSWRLNGVSGASTARSVSKAWMSVSIFMASRLYP